MKICVYCPSDVPYPPNNGVIRANLTVAGDLANELVDLNQDVIFFGPPGSKTRAKLISLQNGSEILSYMEENKLNLLSTHCPPLDIVDYASKKPDITIVITIHDPLSYDGYIGFEKYNNYKNLHFVSLSNGQRKTKPDLRWEQTIYNGIDLSQWAFNANPTGYLLYCGRILPEKGADLAVQIAIKTHLPLKMVGSLYDRDKAFFQEKIAPFLSEDIQYLGVLPREDLANLYGQAIALLAPIRWEEPFGLVYIEANACGTPVIASNHGSVPEIIKNKENGFVISSENNIDEFIQAIKEIGTVRRDACRHYVEKNFTSVKMAQNYLNFYQRLVNPQ